MMGMEVLGQRREEMLREAELNRLKKMLRADRKGPIASGWASTVAWEVTRAIGLLRKSSGRRRTPASAVEAAWTNRETPVR
jgi:hypothetical protein